MDEMIIVLRVLKQGPLLWGPDERPLLAPQGGLAITGPKAGSVVRALGLRPSHHTMSREELLTRYWPVDPQEDAEDLDVGHALTALVCGINARVQAALAASGVAGQGRLIVYHPDATTYSLNTSPVIDSAEFLAASKDGERAARAGRTAEAVAAYTRGVELFDPDAAYTREVVEQHAVLHTHYTAALRFLIEASQASGDSAAALSFLRQYHALDPTDENLTLEYMTYAARTGRRALALLRVYEEYALACRQLDIAPSRAVQRLKERIAADPDWFLPPSA